MHPAIPAIVAGALSAVLVGAAGAFSSLPVWALALASGGSYYTLVLRARREAIAEADRFGRFLQLAFLALLCAAAWDNRGPRHLVVRDAGLVELSGMVAIAAGVWLRQRAIAALGSHFTVKMGLVPGHRVVRTGPYRALRHPNYASLVLLAIGTGLAFASPLAVLVAIVVWVPAIVARVVQEERLLVRSFGEEYERYARDTWRLVPGLF